MTQELFSFWRRAGYRPVYIRQTPSDATGEHTVIMLRTLRSQDLASDAWLDPFVADFRSRFAALLPAAFRAFPPALALSVLDPRLAWSEAEVQAGVQGGLALAKLDGGELSPHDLKRLQAYSANLVDHHLILDLVPPLAGAYFAGRLPATLSYTQAAILLSLGLQRLDIAQVEEALGLPASQTLALFNKALRRLHAHLRAAKEAAVERCVEGVFGRGSCVENWADGVCGVDRACWKARRCGSVGGCFGWGSSPSLFLGLLHSTLPGGPCRSEESTLPKDPHINTPHRPPTHSLQTHFEQDAAGAQAAGPAAARPGPGC